MTSRVSSLFPRGLVAGSEEREEQGEGSPLTSLPAHRNGYPKDAAERLTVVFDAVTADRLALAGYDLTGWWPVMEPLR